jgi:ATP phosphoribosyltransferase regulatory subunit
MRSGAAGAGPTQFLQTGIEYLGAEDRAAADAEVLTLAVEALRAAGLQTFTVQIGDASLFAGLIDALDIPQAWRARLKRHFRRPRSFANLLQRLGSGDAAPGAAWLSQLGRLSEEEARNSLSGLLELLGGTPREMIAGRTREEIVDRLMEQAADASSRHLPKNALAVIEAALAISGPAEKGVAALGAVLKKHGVSLDAQLGALNARIAVLAKLGFAGEQVNFAPRFGRNLDYYTGFVFELWARDADGPVQVAGGGRYDTLMKTLGAASDIPAVGCAIRDERVLAAREAAAA